MEYAVIRRTAALATTLWLTLAAGIVGARDRVFLQLSGDRITIRARRSHLREVLQEFMRCGVYVELDPALDFPVDAALEGVRVEDALDQILATNSYALVWDVMKGPLGEIPRLVQMRVYRRGMQKAAAPLPDRGGLEVEHPEEGAPYVRDEIIIGLCPGTTVRRFQSLLNMIGGTPVEVSELVGVYRVRLPPGSDVPGVVSRLKDQKIVAAVEPNWVVSLPDPGPVTEAQRVSGEVGTGVRIPEPGEYGEEAGIVAVVDSGLQRLDLLDRVVVGGMNVLNPRSPLSDPVGHGTQMALLASGMISPEGSSGKDGRVPIIVVQAFDAEGNTSSFALIRAFEYALEQGARVISMSWGTTTPGRFMKAAVDEALARDVILVAAVGNEPTGKPVYPAAFPGVIGVAALTEGGEVWKSSNFGPFVDVSAPGTARMPVGYHGGPGRCAGTSVSCAVVAHVLARYLGDNPGASAEEVLSHFWRSLTDGGERGRDPFFGAGRLDSAALSRFLHRDAD